MLRFTPRVVTILPLAAGLLCARAPAVHASEPSSWVIPPAPSVGSKAPALADVVLRRPETRPCTVELVEKHDFQGVTPVSFRFAPPADCPGPWAKVVIETDFQIEAGRQFDRTSFLHLGGVDLFYGTTMEPRKTLAQTWRVERDVTEYSALFQSPQAGEFRLDNTVNETYTSHVLGSARLVFYPLEPGAAAPPTAQLVVPVTEGAKRLTQGEPAFEKTIQLPSNTERLYLDLIAEPQADDEFWYGCVPDRLASKPDDRCGGGAFREVQVFIDDHPAGLVPISPWIYTGGVNPYLWYPTPAPETLNFTPARVDLTPFAGLLADGRPHRIAARVVNVRDFVLVTASLLVWRDAGANTVSGGLVEDTLGDPTVTVDDKGAVAEGQVVNGRIHTGASQAGTVSGFVETSHGKVLTAVRYAMTFDNLQDSTTNAKGVGSRIRQTTRLTEESATTDAQGVHRRTQSFYYPLELDSFASPDGLHTDRADVSIDQRIATDEPKGPGWSFELENRVASTAQGRFDPAKRSFVGASGSSRQIYSIRDSRFGCYGRRITVVDNAVSKVADGCTAAPTWTAPKVR